MPPDTYTTASDVFRVAWRGPQTSTTIVLRLRTVYMHLPQPVASCLQLPTLSPAAFPRAAPSSSGTCPGSALGRASWLSVLSSGSAPGSSSWLGSRRHCPSQVSHNGLPAPGGVAARPSTPDAPSAAPTKACGTACLPATAAGHHASVGLAPGDALFPLCGQPRTAAPCQPRPLCLLLGSPSRYPRHGAHAHGHQLSRTADLLQRTLVAASGSGPAAAAVPNA